jgi:uncharacterized protein (DUF2235 family)
MNTAEKPAQHHKGELRQIIICCDGTNNTLTGGPRDTNGRAGQEAK